MDEAGRRRGLLVSQLIEEGEPLLVRVGSSDRAEGDEVPLAIA